MNINVNNLDLGYEECESLNNLVKNSGESLLNSIGTTINELKIHWIGNDASNHINNLITVYETLGALLTDAKKLSSDAGSAIIAIQEVRNANGGSGNIGSMLDASAPNIQAISRMDGTTEYHVDPSANSDYIALSEECSQYEQFVKNFVSGKDELLGNWTAGANHENAVSKFNEFEANCETYKKYLTDAKENLGIAVSNISQL